VTWARIRRAPIEPHLFADPVRGGHSASGHYAQAIRIVARVVSPGRRRHRHRGWLATIHPRDDTFPGEVLPEFATDAIELSGTTRHDPIEFAGIRERRFYMGRPTPRRSTTSTFALRAAMLRCCGPVSIPGCSTRWSACQTDDVWFSSLEVARRLSARCRRSAGESIGTVGQRIADGHGITLDGPARSRPAGTQQRGEHPPRTRQRARRSAPPGAEMPIGARRGRRNSSVRARRSVRTVRSLH